MNGIERETFLLHAETAEHRARVAASEKIIKDCLSSSVRPYVAYSGGKDSTAVLHMVLRQKPGVMVWHWDYGPEFVPREYERESVDIARWMGASNIRLDSTPDQVRGGDNGSWWRSFAGHIKGLREEGFDLVFLGVRGEESGKRRRRLSAGRPGIGIVRECCPLADWSWMDVWAYIVSHGLRYHRVYDLYAPLLGWDKARFASFYDNTLDKIGMPNVDGVLLPGFKHV